MTDYYSNRKYNTLGHGAGNGSTLIYYGSEWVDSASEFAAGETEVTGINLENTTAATVGTDQYSPFLVISGQAWDSDGAVSATRSMRFGVRTYAANSPRCIGVFSLTDSAGNEVDVLKFDGSNPSKILADFTNQCKAPILACGGSFLIQEQSANAKYTGQAATELIEKWNDDNPMTFINYALTDQASGVAFESVWDANAASITNRTKLHRFGWVDDSNTYQESMAIMEDSAIKFSTVYTYATAPSAASRTGDVIAVSDHYNGATDEYALFISDGTDWVLTDGSGTALTDTP